MHPSHGSRLRQAPQPGNAVAGAARGCRGRGKDVRTDRWKYCVTPCDVDERYDLARGPHERENLLADPQHANVVQDLQRRLRAWLITPEKTRTP
jgi:hypothetical protein